MKKCSIFHCSFPTSFSLFPFVTFNGNCILFICSFLLAAKLKMKSSNNSSAAFGIGCSVMSCSSVSAVVVSVVSTIVESETDAFFSVHPVVVHIVSASATATTNNTFLIVFYTKKQFSCTRAGVYEHTLALKFSQNYIFILLSCKLFPTKVAC